MSNGLEHRQAAALVLGATHLIQQANNGEFTAGPLVTAAGGYALGTLPDILEPATSPRHRAFLHSYGALALVGWSGWKLYHWEPDDDDNRMLRWIGFVALGAYGLHLLMDSRTPAGLPLL